MIGNMATKVDPAIQHMRQQLRQIDQGRTQSRIDTMLRTGKTLTQREMDYLRARDPRRYEEALRIEQQRRAYRQAVSRARSKQEARSLRRDYTALYAGQAQGGGADEAQAQISAMAQEHDRFTATAHYARLPEKTPPLKRRAGSRPRVNLTI